MVNYLRHNNPKHGALKDMPMFDKLVCCHFNSYWGWNPDLLTLPVIQSCCGCIWFLSAFNQPVSWFTLRNRVAAPRSERSLCVRASSSAWAEDQTSSTVTCLESSLYSYPDSLDSEDVFTSDKTFEHRHKVGSRRVTAFIFWLRRAFLKIMWLEFFENSMCFLL